MRKKVSILVSILCLLLLITGCSEKSNEDMIPYEAYDLSEYVTLGQYKGVEVEQIDPAEVTDEAMEMRIASVLISNATVQEVTEGEVQTGDTANINYEGKVDGVAFEGGTAEEFDLIIGSSQFIAGFEDGLIGKTIGDTVELDLTFPEEYPNSPEMAGKDVVFTVKINYVNRKVARELTDEFVEEISDFKTVDEYRADLRIQMEKEAVDTADNAMQSALMNTIIESSEVISYPEKEFQQYKDDYYGMIESEASYYGMTVEDYLAQMNTTAEEFDKEVESYVEMAMKQEMVIYAIAQAEKVELTEEEYQEGAQEYVGSMGLEDIAALEESYGKKMIEGAVLWNKTIDYVYEQANFVPAIADDDSGNEDEQAE